MSWLQGKKKKVVISPNSKSLYRMHILGTEPTPTFAEDWGLALAYQLPPSFSIPSSSEEPVLLCIRIFPMFCSQGTLDKTGIGLGLAFLAHVRVRSETQGKNFGRKIAVQMFFPLIFSLLNVIKLLVILYCRFTSFNPSVGNFEQCATGTS